MSSLFDFDDSRQIAFEAKTAGKALIAAKYETLEATGDFLFNAHSDGEFAERCAMIDDQLGVIAYNKLASVSDSKMKLVKALHTEWSLRHAKCDICKIAKSTCEKCNEGEIDSDSPLCKACRSKESSRRLAKSVCEKCKEGEIDSDSPLCKACRNQEKKAAKLANNYIEKRGDSWVILQKGTGKVLSHHDSKEKAEASFRAMMQSKHGSKGDQSTCAECGAPATNHDVRGYLELCDKCNGKTASRLAHMADGNYCSNCDGAGCSECGMCGKCGNDVDVYGDHYGSIGCPADDNHGLDDMMRHDQGHDKWHAMYGDSPCTSEEDCAAKRSRYDDIDNMRENGEPKRETDLHDELHEKWHRDHGDEPCTSAEDCDKISASYND